MLSFELILIRREDSPIDRQAVWRNFEENPHVHPERGVPGKFTYYNRATTVHFSITLGDEFHTEIHGEDEVGGSILDRLDVLSESSVGSQMSRLDEEEWEEEDDGGDEEEEEEDHIELPPVSVHIPLFRPTFFLVEGLGFIESAGAAGNLQLAISQDDTLEHSPLSTSRADVLKHWQESHRQVFGEVQDKEKVQVWSTDRCAAFYDYNCCLSGLQEEFAPGGHEVVPIQPAHHDGTTKTLCVWRCDRPAILPQTDLVLVQRPRPRGLFRRVKLEEFLVPGETLWKILERFSESRYEPAPLLIVRGLEDSPGQLRAELEALRGEPAENARRTELAGVVDFELLPREDEPPDRVADFE